MDEFFDKVDNLLHNLTMINIDEVKDEVISNLKITVNNYLLSISYIYKFINLYFYMPCLAYFKLIHSITYN